MSSNSVEIHLSNSTMGFSTTTYEDETIVYMCSNDESIKFGAAAVPFFYYTVFTLSLLGNGLILFLLLKYEKIKTVTNLFILNLVISDLLFTITLPFWAFYHSNEWVFGNGMCKVVSSVFFIGFFSCILFLTVMTMDRYLAVVHAVSAARTRKLIYVYVASIAIWVISFVSTVPKFVLYGTRKHDSAGILCEETGFSADKIDTWRRLGYYQQLTMFFLFPLIVILYCYTLIVVKLFNTKMHNKDKAVKLISVIVLAFFICWTPYNVVIFLRLSPGDPCNDYLNNAFYICRNIAYFHCCINPFFYTFVGTKFRRHLSALLGTNCLSMFRRSSSSSRTSEYSPQTIYE
ncbi:chemokine (C-C motif) receptor 3 [Xenopus tropicalis]|uniref:Chemokine (C-C motif) receptor 3 n=1 Tax=Xenopus tropicalis TaxID=8364 RepID=A9UL51_XENTR|nr:chemokine (C-C motif) receptor 3 [Xenopus tropicalis]AAI55501.1 LOC100135154 protein [Xenopus tropicalis]|eukprot:NP_001107334.1 chemokine (C-C motif) receptor 3 [Xenopus tropicalis]